MEGQYPIDLDGLVKGQVLGVQRLEELTGVTLKKDPERYRMRVLALQGFINSKSSLTAKFEGNELRILTDAEASVYNTKRAESHRAGIFFRNGKLMQVDVALLSEDERRDYDSNLLRISRWCSQLLRPVKTVTPPADVRHHSRQLPVPEDL
jgi:hypothetical protein